MKGSETQWRWALVALGVVALGGAILGAWIAVSCAPSPTPAITPVGIDAGPGMDEIGARLDASVREAEARIAEIEREHAADLARFEGEQARKYEVVRAQGPDAVEVWLEGFNRSLLRDGGR